MVFFAAIFLQVSRAIVETRLLGRRLGTCYQLKAFQEIW